jgi:hypothetical protein
MPPYPAHIGKNRSAIAASPNPIAWAPRRARLRKYEKIRMLLTANAVSTSTPFCAAYNAAAPAGKPTASVIATSFG